VYGTIYFHATQSALIGQGVLLNCLERGPCIQNGDFVSSNDFTNNTISGFIFTNQTSFSSNPSYAGVPITNTVVTSNIATITTSSAHGFRPGDIVTIEFTDMTCYWGDAVVLTAPTATTFTYAHPKCTTGGNIASQNTPGLVALTYVAVLDNSTGTHLQDLSTSNYGNFGQFNNFIDFWDDENALVEHINASGGLNYNANWVASYIYSGGASNTANGSQQLAPVISVRDSSFTANLAECGTVYNSNGLYVDNTVCQSYALWAFNVSNTTGNFQGATFKDIYDNGSANLNISNHTPFSGTGSGGLLIGPATGASTFSIMGNGGFTGQFATGGTGSTPYTYYIVANDTTAGTQTSPMQILNWESTGSDTIPVKWPRIANGTDNITYDVIRMTTAVGINGTYPYAGGCPGGSGGTCGSVATGLTQASACSGALTCTYTDTGSSTTSSYAVKIGNYIGQINYWPGSIADVGGNTHPGVKVNTEQGNVVAIGMGANPLQISNDCTGFGVTTAGGGYTDCLSSPTTANNSVPNQNATFMTDGTSNGGAMSMSKGRLNFSMSPYATTLFPHHIITLVDSQSALTRATTAFRPPASPNDAYIGIDVASSGVAGTLAQLSFGAPVAISSYIANIGTNNTGYLERLTASLKTFNVPLQMSSYHDVQEIAAPSNPASGYERWYANSSTHLQTCLTSSGGNCAPSGGTTASPSLENCAADQSGNSFPQVTSLTNWFSAHWEFLFNTTTYINCQVFIPTAQTGATLVVDVFSADSTAGHTANIQTCDAILTTGSLNVGSLTCASAQTYTTTATAYQRVTLTFNVQSTLVNNGILVVKIGTSPTGTAPTSDIIILPHFIL
jgi:hypothetical protein